VRERLTVQCSLRDFAALFDATVEFVATTEKLCGPLKMQQLRSGLLSQVSLSFFF